jgi:hypothetical protein
MCQARFYALDATALKLHFSRLGPRGLDLDLDLDLDELNSRRDHRKAEISIRYCGA